jgi:hypothetical protein
MWELFLQHSVYRNLRTQQMSVLVLLCTFLHYMFRPISKQKWVTFTYIGSQTRTITKLFKNTDLRIAYRTNNRIQNYLQSKNRDPDKYNHSGIYELKCNNCQLKYIGQTGRNFRTRYREHIMPYTPTKQHQNMHNIS